MKISKLIQKLEEFKIKYGDLEVIYEDYENGTTDLDPRVVLEDFAQRAAGKVIIPKNTRYISL